jgi:hypothetical protein
MLLTLLILLSIWLLPAIVCFIIVQLIKHRTDFNWHTLDSASRPYKAFLIVRIMSWIPFANIPFSKELYDLYRELREDDRIQRFEELRKK